MHRGRPARREVATISEMASIHIAMSDEVVTTGTSPEIGHSPRDVNDMARPPIEIVHHKGQARLTLKSLLLTKAWSV